MKTSLATRFLAVLLMIMLLAAMSMQVFAQEVETVEPVETASGCMHNWVEIGDTDEYTSYDASMHYYDVYVIKRCAKCGERIAVKAGSGRGEHIWTTETFTGNHHHEGTSLWHVAEYRCKCFCGYTTIKERRYSCPGNGHCLYP